MSQLTDEGVRCAESGKILGQLVRQHYAKRYEDFVRLAVEGAAPLFNVVLHVGYTRTPFRSAETLRDDLAADPRPRRLESLLRSAWAVYRSLRRHACPRSQQPVVQPEEVPLQFTRAVSSYLRHSGVQPEHQEWRASERKRLASERLQELWGQMAGRTCVVWYDNFYKRLYHATPRGPVTNLNTTAMSVMRPLGGDELPRFDGYPSLEQLWRRTLDVAEELCDMATERLRALIDDIAAEPLGAAEFRVPLDVPRDDARAPVWRSFSLSEDVVGTQVGMLRVLRFLRDQVAPHAREPLPLLVDENLWYRQMKLVYGREAQRWDAAAALEQVPPLYGVWHPYKQVLHVVYRRVLPVFVFLQRGTLEVGAVWTENPKLRTLECWIGAILMLPTDRRLRICAYLREAVGRLEELRDEVTERDAKVLHCRNWLDQAREKAERLRDRVAKGHAREKENLERAEALLRRNTLAWEQAVDKRKRASDSLRRVRRDAAVLQALHDVVTVWAPACFALGWRVRDCHWMHRAMGTGAYAKETLRTSLVMLLLLEGPARTTLDGQGAHGRRQEGPTAGASRQGSGSTIPARSSGGGGTPRGGGGGGQEPVEPRGALSEYVRTLSCALLTWTPWHDRIPGCCYSEELNEAALGRLGSSMRRHPDATTVEAVMDLWIRVKPGRRGYKKIRPGGVDEKWRQQLLGHVDELLARCDPSLPVDQRVGAAEVVRYVGRRKGRGEAMTEGGGEEADDEGQHTAEASGAEGEWPGDWMPPRVPQMDTEDWRAVRTDYQDVLQRTMATLMQDNVPSDVVAAEMDALCPRRADRVVANYHQEWDSTAGRKAPRGRAKTSLTDPDGSTLECRKGELPDLCGVK